MISALWSIEATMATKSSDNTDTNEIPTAVMERHPSFDDSESTAVGDSTLEATPTPEGFTTPGFKKLRRPTESEIAKAVDQVNTESVDMEELAQARAAQQATDEEGAEEHEDDED